VAGLRALLRNHPNALSELVRRHDLDVLCLQEHKLQESHLDDAKLGNIRSSLLHDEGYDSYYSCSTAKKGYSGTAVFIKRWPSDHAATKPAVATQRSVASYFGKPNATKSKTTKDMQTTNDSIPDSILSHLVPSKVSFAMGQAKHDSEGRIILVEFPSFSMCNVYVPNSGSSLERLSYRTDEWDRDFLAFMQSKQENSGERKPVLWVGDLNVAHTGLEVWNDGAKHLAKQAGVTEEERASFQQMLDAGFVDAFRKLHPTARGHYSYWSQRAGNRTPNKGLRLDYFICDPLLFDESSHVVVRDSYMDIEQLGSDHCPVILTLEVKPKNQSLG
jgi:exodeoxyribonuclease III